MKTIAKSLIIFCVLCILGTTAWFVYTRFCLAQYRMDANTLSYNNEIYVMQDYCSTSDEENVGRTIGIGVSDKRTLADLIWPFWVMEFKSDKEHNSLFLKGLMGSGGKYSKVDKVNYN